MYEFIINNGDIILKLITAMGLGMAIGLERLLAHKEAGMKTHALVAVGSCLFIVISELLAVKYVDFNAFDPSKIASQIIVGVGFFGAGSIILQGSRLKGFTTAGGLWVTAGIGMACGFGFYNLALIVTVLVLMILTLMNIIEKPIKEKYNDGNLYENKGGTGNTN